LGPGAERGGRRRIGENYGEEGLEMEMMLPRAILRQLLQRFLQQRRQARQRGIQWQLDYWEWLRIWQDSGHLHERGRHRGKWQRSPPGRPGPKGTLTPQNEGGEPNPRGARAPHPPHPPRTPSHRLFKLADVDKRQSRVAPGP